MLGGLALKRRWRERRTAAGRPTDRPNLVMGANVQVCWEKFCRLLGRRAAARADGAASGSTSAPHEAVALCDENTIGVVAILGSTFDGSYEPVAEIAAALDELAGATPASTSRSTSTPPPAASSRRSCDPELDLGLPAAAGRSRSTPRATSTAWSTRASGGCVWRDAAALPEELVFKVNYLGGEMPTFALNFSRPGAQVIAQYYTFLRLGREGYRARPAGVPATWRPRLAEQIDAHAARSGCSPTATSCRCSRSRTADERRRLHVFDVSERAARARLASCPPTRCPADLEDLAVLRVVVRNGFTHDMAAASAATSSASRRGSNGRRRPRRPRRAGFHH